MGFDLSELQKLKSNNANLSETQIDKKVNEVIQKYEIIAEKKQFFLKSNYKSYDIKGVQPDYYDKTLPQRVEILNAPSENHLCKSIMMENTAFNPQYESKYYQKIYCVIVQYSNKFSTQKLEKWFVQFHNENAQQTILKKDVHFRFLEHEESAKITGYGHNAVTPFQLKTKVTMILAKPIYELQPQCFWLGGGHIDVKIRVSVEEFISLAESDVFVGDII